MEYALSKQNKVIDNADQNKDVTLNTWEILLPEFDQEKEHTSQDTLLIDEAAQVRRKIIRSFVLKFYFNDKKELKVSSIPEAFGDPDNFIATLTAVIPPTLKPEHIGVPFPQISVLT